MLMVILGTGFLAFATQGPRAVPGTRVNAHLQQGLDLLREGNFERARDEFKTARSLSPFLLPPKF